MQMEKYIRIRNIILDLNTFAMYPYVAGGADGDEEDPPADPPAKTFTQADLDRVAAARAKDGEKAGVRKLLEDLGVTDPDEIKAILAKAKEAEEKETSETDKAKREAATEKAAREAADRKSSEITLTNRVEKMLVRHGKLTLEAAERARRLVDVPTDADDDAIKAAIDAVKVDMPSLFPEEKEDEETPPRRAPAPPTPPKKTQGGSVQDRTQELLQRRHGAKLSASKTS